jgi:hypothetical protein
MRGNVFIVKGRRWSAAGLGQRPTFAGELSSERPVGRSAARTCAGHFAACFRAFATGFHAFLAVIHLVPAALLATRIAHLGAELAHARAANCEPRDISRIANEQMSAQLRSSSTHRTIILTSSSCRQAVAQFSHASMHWGHASMQASYFSWDIFAFPLVRVAQRPRV